MNGGCVAVTVGISIVSLNPFGEVVVWLVVSIVGLAAVVVLVLFALRRSMKAKARTDRIRALAVAVKTRLLTVWTALQSKAKIAVAFWQVRGVLTRRRAFGLSTLTVTMTVTTSL